MPQYVAEPVRSGKRIDRTLAGIQFSLQFPVLIARRKGHYINRMPFPQLFYFMPHGYAACMIFLYRRKIG